MSPHLYSPPIMLHKKKKNMDQQKKRCSKFKSSRKFRNYKVNPIDASDNIYFKNASKYLLLVIGTK